MRIASPSPLYPSPAASADGDKDVDADKLEACSKYIAKKFFINKKKRPAPKFGVGL